MNPLIDQLARQAGACLLSRAVSTPPSLMLTDEQSITLFAELLRAEIRQKLEQHIDNIPMSDMSDWQLGRRRGIQKCLDTVDTLFRSNSS
jgi:hypothetical protein